MSDQPTNLPAKADVEPKRLAKVYTPVDSVMGIMDTARFEHLGRVASVMARAGLLPESLTHEGPANNRVPIPFEVLQARAYLIANQADLWHADPMAVAQCTSLVHGKLMYEGKLVAGMVAARLGVDLEYEFGRYDPRTRDIVIGEMPTPGERSLGVRVSGTLPGETKPRWIAGSVAMWHKGEKSPWGNESAWPRQLRYMGAREWTRAYKPSLLLGIITDDEIEEYDLARQVGAIGPAQPPQLHSGFEDRGVATIEQPEKPKRTPRKAADSKPEGDADTSAGEEVTEGHAGIGESYLLANDPFVDGRRLTYRDGERFSSVSFEGAKKLKVYEEHSPIKIEENSAEDEEDSDNSVDMEESAESDEGEGTSERDLPPEFAAYIAAIEETKDFDAVKVALKTLQGTAFWEGLSEDQKNEVRRSTWETMAENMGDNIPDPGVSTSAFRLWIEAQNDIEEIEAGLSRCEESEMFRKSAPATQEVLRGAAQARINAISEQ